jgi:hypothetical protein
MGDDAARHSGHCLCGAVRFEAAGAPLWTALCHCESCRRSTGGALVAACGYPREKVVFMSGAPTYYASSPGVRRGFCGACGTSLTFESTRWPGDVHLMVGNFDHPEHFAPQCHVFAGEQLSWLKFGDGLPRYRTVPSAGDLIGYGSKASISQLASCWPVSI